MVYERLPAIFLREIYEKDIKFIKVYDQYFPNYKETTTTPKFYAKHEHADDDEVDPVIFSNLRRAKDMGPKQKREWPETVNQIYGWFSVPVVEVDRNDSRFYSPKTSSEITRHGLEAMRKKQPKK